MKKEINLTKCRAYDETGREFKKDVRIFESFFNGKWILSFGGWCSYYLNTLKGDYPFTKIFYIDIDGQNHHGSPTFIKFEDMNKIFEMIKERGLIEDV